MKTEEVKTKKKDGIAKEEKGTPLTLRWEWRGDQEQQRSDDA